MKAIIPILAGALVLAGAASAVAGDEEVVVEEKIVIALKTDDFEIEETDLSHLAVGDAETIVTGSGKTVDLLRTEDGIEVYVDGELMDAGAHHDVHHVAHTVEIICDDETDCDENVWISRGGEFDFTTDGDGEKKFIVIKGEDEEWDVEMLPDGAHEVHGTVHIVREFSEDMDLGDLHEAHGDLHEGVEHDVIIIKKKLEDEI